MGSLNIHVTIYSNFIQELRFNRLNGAGALAGAGAFGHAGAGALAGAGAFGHAGAGALAGAGAFGPAGAVFSPGLTLCSFQEVG